MAERTKEQMEAAHKALMFKFYPKARGTWAFRGWGTSVAPTVSPSGVCCSTGCKRPAVRRVRINVWGTLCERDVCVRHCRWSDGRPVDGSWCDDLPMAEWLPKAFSGLAAQDGI